MAVADADYEFVYQYSPSKRSDPDALQQAKEDGCVIMEDGEVTGGLHRPLYYLYRFAVGKEIRMNGESDSEQTGN